MYCAQARHNVLYYAWSDTQASCSCILLLTLPSRTSLPFCLTLLETRTPYPKNVAWWRLCVRTYRPLHTTVTLAVDMQTRCTLVQCRTPREVRYLSSKANSFPRSIVFPGAIAFSTHANPPPIVPCQRTTTVCTCSRPPGNPKA